MYKKAIHRISGNTFEILGVKGDKIICIGSNKEIIELNEELLVMIKDTELSQESVLESVNKVLSSLEHLLSVKNVRYGNSALELLEDIKYTPEDGIKIRLVDKMKRIINSNDLRKNDLADCMGYLTLLCVLKEFTDFNDLID